MVINNNHHLREFKMATGESFSISFVTVNKLSRKVGLKVSKPPAKAKDKFSFLQISSTEYKCKIKPSFFN